MAHTLATEDSKESVIVACVVSYIVLMCAAPGAGYGSCPDAAEARAVVFYMIFSPFPIAARQSHAILHDALLP